MEQGKGQVEMSAISRHIENLTREQQAIRAKCLYLGNNSAKLMLMNKFGADENCR